MRRRFRQVVAGLLTAMTIATTVPLDLVYASDQLDQAVGNSEGVEVLDMDGLPDLDKDGQLVDMPDLGDVEQQPDQVEMNDVEEQPDTDISEDTEQPAEENAQEPEMDGEALINFVAVDAGRIEVGGTQNIVVDIGDSSQTITAAVLGYHRASDNSTYETEAVMISGNGLRFSMNYTSQSQAGEYVLDYLNYTMNGKSYTVQFETAGMDIRYGVGIDVQRTPDAEVVDEPESAVNLEVVSFDENGQQTSEQSIADAIAGQQSNGVRRARYNGNLVVVLDPGHDASHAGAYKNGLKEQDLTLKIAQYCKEELEKYSGVTVYMTRTTAACAFGGDNSNCLKSRAQYAQSVGANVFVSLHLNSNTNTSAYGVEIYRPNTNYRPDIHNTAKDLADDILEQLAALGLNNRGTFVRSCQDVDDPEYIYPDGSHADYYAVIRNCKRVGIPALIVEHAFLSNASDVANYLNSEEKLKRLGVADATGIANYFGLTATGGYSAVFDATYYADHNADLKAAFGYDASALLSHFQNYGMSEGRRGNEAFDVYSYRNAYVDLRQVFGNDLKQYYMHYIQYGQYENRITSGVDTIQNPTTVYGGVDYAAVYDCNYYLNKYPDLKAAFRGDEQGALAHFVTYGMSEKRQAKETFDPISYYNAHKDLRAAFGTEWKSYYLHYMNYGAKEKRTATGVTVLENPLTVWNGKDYKAVYDYNYYLNKYPDLKTVYNGDEQGALSHFVTYGMDEGRVAKSTFIVSIYMNNYLDLKRIFGNNLKSYYVHYMDYGQKEGRNAVTAMYHNIMGGPTTTVAQMANFYNAKASYPSFYATTDAKTVNDLCQIFYEESVYEGVDPAVAFCQTILETGWLQFNGDVKIEQFNFAGIGATGGGAPGNSFPSARIGIRAQIQHLKAYATSEAVKREIVDPRYAYVPKGSAPYVEWLGQQENPNGYGWATGKDYGTKILNLMGQLYTY